MEFLIFPGESASLWISLTGIAGATALATFLTYGSFGALLILLAIVIFLYRIREARNRMSLPRATPNLYPVLANLGRLAAFRLDVVPTELFIEPENEPRAYCQGFWGRHWITLSSPLVEICEPAEALFVIGHELGHIKRNHTSWLLLTSPRSSVGIPFLSDVMSLFLNRWSLRAEYTADRSGLFACRDLETAISALAKVHFWGQPVDIEQFVQTGLSDFEDPVIRASEYFGDHPFLANRIQQLILSYQVMKREGLI